MNRAIATMMAYERGHMLIGYWVEARGLKGTLVSKCRRCYRKVGIFADGSISGQAISTCCDGTRPHSSRMRGWHDDEEVHD